MTKKSCKEITIQKKKKVFGKKSAWAAKSKMFE